MCGKEPPIGLDEQERNDEPESGSTSAGKKLTLRQRKAQERQEANNVPRSKRRGEANVTAMEQSSQAGSDNEMDTGMDAAEVDAHEDPFLQAIGGSFVTGDAYRQKLLQQQGNNATASMEDN